jgi:hypothetical protein
MWHIDDSVASLWLKTGKLIPQPLHKHKGFKMKLNMKIAMTTTALLLIADSALGMVSRRIVPGELTLPTSDMSSFINSKAAFASANVPFDLETTLGSFAGPCEAKYEEFGPRPALTYLKMPNNFMLHVQKVSIPENYGALLRSKTKNENHIDYPIALNASIDFNNSLNYQRSNHRAQKTVTESPNTAATLFYSTIREGSKWIGLWDFMGTRPNSISNPEVEMVELAKDEENRYFARFFANWKNQFQHQMPINVTLYCGPLRFTKESELRR